MSSLRRKRDSCSDGNSMTWTNPETHCGFSESKLLNEAEEHTSELIERTTRF